MARAAAAQKPVGPAEADFEGWIRTVWEGTKYPPFYICYFRHHVRVRKGPDGRIQAEYFDDETRIPGAGGNVWRRIVSASLAQRLYTQATEQEAAHATRA
jgi:hypothetical protein